LTWRSIRRIRFRRPWIISAAATWRRIRPKEDLTAILILVFSVWAIAADVADLVARQAPAVVALEVALHDVALTYGREDWSQRETSAEQLASWKMKSVTVPGRRFLVETAKRTVTCEAKTLTPTRHGYSGNRNLSGNRSVTNLHTCITYSCTTSLWETLKIRHFAASCRPAIQ
jgi:hypothetical protein